MGFVIGWMLSVVVCVAIADVVLISNRLAASNNRQNAINGADTMAEKVCRKFIAN